MRHSGVVTSYCYSLSALNPRGGNWSAVQVARLLEAVGSRFDGAKVGAHPKAIYIHTAIHIVATKNRMMLA
jgi:hypothetical protein